MIESQKGWQPDLPSTLIHAPNSWSQGWRTSSRCPLWGSCAHVLQPSRAAFHNVHEQVPGSHTQEPVQALRRRTQHCKPCHSAEHVGFSVLYMRLLSYCSNWLKYQIGLSLLSWFQWATCNNCLSLHRFSFPIGNISLSHCNIFRRKLERFGFVSWTDAR